jgi:hypothetical protein
LPERLTASRRVCRSGREKFEAKEQGAVKTRKAVNYLTPNMQVVDGPFESIDSDEVVIALTIYHHKKQAKIQVLVRVCMCACVRVALNDSTGTQWVRRSSWCWAAKS